MNAYAKSTRLRRVRSADERESPAVEPLPSAVYSKGTSERQMNHNFELEAGLSIFAEGFYSHYMYYV